jgi:hypothetical protein
MFTAVVSQPEPDHQAVAGHPAVQWHLHGFRLDYGAALRAISAGRPAADVAIAAGSKARDRRNLQRVGLEIIDKLVSRGGVYDAFRQLGYGIEEFCRGVIAATEATKKKYVYERGKVVAVYEDPDWKARAAARDQYMRSIGVERWPLGNEPTGS